MALARAEEAATSAMLNKLKILCGRLRQLKAQLRHFGEWGWGMKLANFVVGVDQSVSAWWCGGRTQREQRCIN